MATATASIVDAYNLVMDITKSGTSGQDSQDEFNRRVKSVQRTLVEMLVDVDEDNQKVTDALKWLKKPSDELTSDANGQITFPDDYLHLVTVSFINAGGDHFPTTKISDSSVDMVRTSPIRKANLTKNKINYYLEEGALYVQPEQAGIKVRMKYIMEVPDATIKLTPVNDDSGDYVTVEADTDFGWPTSVFNILTYLLLEQYGIEIKENLMVEFAQYGISKEAIRSNTSDKSIEENIRWGNRN